MMIMLTLALVKSVFGLTANVRWNNNPAEDEVTHYEVRYGKAPGVYDQGFTTLTNTAAIINLEPGVTYYFVVVAFNAYGQSEPSDMVSKLMPKPPTKPGGVQVVEVLVSSNLTDWETIAFVPLIKKDQPARFIKTNLAMIYP